MNVWNFNETLTNDVVSFEQPGPEYLEHYCVYQLTCLKVYLNSSAKNSTTGNWEFDSNLLRWMLTNNVRKSVNFSI